MSETPELEPKPTTKRVGEKVDVAAMQAEIDQLKAQLAAAPKERPTAPLRVGGTQVMDTPAYTDTDLVPEWVTPSELCGVRLDEEVTIGSAKGKAHTFRPGTVYRNVEFGIIRQAMALWGAYALGQRELLINRGTTKTYLGEMH